MENRKEILGKSEEEKTGVNESFFTGGGSGVGKGFVIWRG
jgi:hypothetical protein